MQKLLIGIGGAALLAASFAAAYAAEATGKISAIDPTAGTVTLADGAVYVMAASVNVAELEVGQEVMIRYEQAGGGQFMASEVMPVSSY